MLLHVHTARIHYSGPDRLDVTAKSATAEGKPFAPTWALVNWGLRMRSQAEQKKLRREPGADSYADWAWKLYAMRYREQMRVSYVHQRRAWDDLLKREHVVFVCYCVDPEHCHRRVLAEIFDKLGAHDAGELHEHAQATGSLR